MTMRYAWFIWIALFTLGGCAPASLPSSTPDPGAAGRYPVGFVFRAFTRTLADGQVRKLATDIWYPGRSGQTEDSGAFVEGLHATTQLAPGNESSHPLVIFSHGYSVSPLAYSLFLSHLASQGFVVAAPEHNDCGTSPCVQPPFYSEPTTRAQADRRVEDIPFVLDNVLALSAQQDPVLKGMVNPNQVGLAGQSFGGWTTLQVLRAEPRFRAGLAMNAATFIQPPPDPAHVSRPTLFMAGELDPMVPFTATEAFFAKIPPTAPDHFLLLVPRAGHEFGDRCFAPGLILSCASAMPQDQLNEIMARVGTAFLLTYVADQPGYGPILDGGGTADYTLMHTLSGATPIPFPTPAPIPFPASSAPPPTRAGPPGTVILRDSGGLLPAGAGGPGRYVEEYEQGEYVIRSPAALAPGATFWNQAQVVLPGTYADVSISVDALLVDPSDDQFLTVACRSADPGSQYRLTIGPGNGIFVIVRWVGGKAITLVGPEVSPSVRTGGQSNTLELRCRGSVLDAVINGVHVASFTDTTFKDGRLWIGLSHGYGSVPGGASTPLNKAIEGHFTNLVVAQQ